MSWIFWPQCLKGKKKKSNWEWFALIEKSIKDNDTIGNKALSQSDVLHFQEQIHDFLKWELRGLNKYCSSTMITSQRERAAHAVKMFERFRE